jgi:toxin FitB
MILLDTNVISEIWRPKPDATVLAWFKGQPAHSLYLCTPVLAELRFGAERLALGHRKKLLQEAIDRLEAELYRDRILGFDASAASEFGRIAATRERAGRRIEAIDAFIAAIALAHRAALATRDTDDFSDIGLEIINPFEVAA